jgi:thioredoxin 1
MVREVKDAEFVKEVLEANGPVLVDFWVPWCGPCRMIAPIVDEIGRDYEGRVKVLKLNVDDSQATAMACGVSSIPALLVFHGGVMVGGVMGAVPRAEIAKRLDSLLERQTPVS